jgi:hypothetical protein
MTSIVAILVMVVSVRFLEKDPNTYPIINTMEVTNNILVKMIPKNIMMDFDVKKWFTYAAVDAAALLTPVRNRTCICY